MAAVGGSIESVSVAGRIFAVAADADGTRKLGGYSNEVQANGNGTARIVKTYEAWSIEGLTLVVDDSRGDHEFLQDVAEGNGMVPITITYVSGITYQGTGTITGGIAASSQNATAEVAFGGEGALTAQ